MKVVIPHKSHQRYYKQQPPPPPLPAHRESRNKTSRISVSKVSNHSNAPLLQPPLTPAVLFGEHNGVDGLGDGPDLVHLEKQGVARTLVHCLANFGNVGDGEIVADDLASFSNPRRQLSPAKDEELKESEESEQQQQHFKKR